MRLYILTLFFINLLFAQAVNWDNRARYTAMKISCDTDSVPIYLDGYYIGKTPIKQALTVTPGWHKVSIFPPDDGIPEQSVPSNKTYQRQTQSGTWVRASMIFALLFIIIWGL